MANIKAGKKPASQQRRPGGIINPDEIFNSGLAVPKDVAAHAEANGWELRWVNGTDMVRNSGQHKRGWIAYIKPKEMRDADSSAGFKFGNDPDGLVRRQDCILAYRPKAQGDKHRAYNQQRADQLSGNFRKEEHGRLANEARKTGLNISVFEDEDGDE